MPHYDGQFYGQRKPVHTVGQNFKVLYCKLPTIDKQLPAFRGVTSTNNLARLPADKNLTSYGS